MQTENAFILALLTQVGKNLSDGCYKLAVNDERKKDFFKLMKGSKYDNFDNRNSGEW